MCQTAHVWCIAFVRYAQLWCFSKYICMHYSLQKYNSSTFLTWNIRFPTSSQGSFCKTGPGHFKPQFGSHHRLRKIRGHVATTQETLASCRVSVLGDSAVTHFLYREGQPLTPPIRRDLPQRHLFHQWRAGRTPKAEESPSAFRTPPPEPPWNVPHTVTAHRRLCPFHREGAGERRDAVYGAVSASPRQRAAQGHWLSAWRAGGTRAGISCTVATVAGREVTFPKHLKWLGLATTKNHPMSTFFVHLCEI